MLKILWKFIKDGNFPDVKSTLFDTPDWLSKEDKSNLLEGKQKMINEYGIGGWTPLHYAIFYHQNEIAQYLIKM